MHAALPVPTWCIWRTMDTSSAQSRVRSSKWSWEIGAFSDFLFVKIMVHLWFIYGSSMVHLCFILFHLCFIYVSSRKLWFLKQVYNIYNIYNYIIYIYITMYIYIQIQYTYNRYTINRTSWLVASNLRNCDDVMCPIPVIPDCYMSPGICKADAGSWF